MSLRDEYRERPQGMKPLDFPHKNNIIFRPIENTANKTEEAWNLRSNPQGRYNAFNENVKKLRQLLNKLSPNNFQDITEKILRKTNFTPSLLKELSVSGSLLLTRAENPIPQGHDGDELHRAVLRLMRGAVPQV